MDLAQASRSQLQRQLESTGCDDDDNFDEADLSKLPYGGFFLELDNKPALMRAFKRATSGSGGGDGDEYVQRHEFRSLMRNLWFFNKVWKIFDEMDLDGDRRLDIDEFKCGLERMHILLSDDEATAAFDSMDVGGVDGAGAGGGMVLFDEFSFFVMRKMGLEVGEQEQSYELATATATSTAVDSSDIDVNIDADAEDASKLSSPTKKLKEKMQTSPFSVHSPRRTKKNTPGGSGSGSASGKGKDKTKRSRIGSPSRSTRGNKSNKVQKTQHAHAHTPARQSRLRLEHNCNNDADAENQSPNPTPTPSKSAMKGMKGKKPRPGEVITGSSLKSSTKSSLKSGLRTPRAPRAGTGTPISKRLRSADPNKTPGTGTGTGKKSTKGTFGTTSRF